MRGNPGRTLTSSCIGKISGLIINVLQNYRVQIYALKEGGPCNENNKRIVSLVRRDLLKRYWNQYDDEDISIKTLHWYCSHLVSNFMENFDYTILDYGTGMTLLIFYLIISNFKKAGALTGP